MNGPPSTGPAATGGGPTCPDCGAPIPRSIPGGFCPSCILGLAASSHDVEVAEDRREADAGPRERRYLGDYELVREIARGGMGVVHEARQISLDRTVALKTIDARLLGSGAARMRFRIEIETAARLDHPNIVPLYETGEHDSQSFYAMRFVPGGSLSAALAAGGLPLTRLIGILAKVAGAVQHAHEHGVLHRDIKPSNILLDREGEPYLADFGLAKVAEIDAGLTGTEAMLGSPCYMAPEQIAGGESVTTASDVYALGAVLYEILAGRPPFVGATALETVRKVADEDPVPPHALRSFVSHDLEAICLKCLEKNPARRYPSARELAEDLGRWQRREPVLARRIGPLQRCWRWCRRHPVMATLGAASLVFLVTIAVVSAAAAVRIAEARDRTAQLLAGVRLEKAETLLAQDQTGAGLALLARVCRDHPENEPAHRRLLAALDSRTFAEEIPPRIVGAERPITLAPDFATASLHLLTEDGTAQTWNVGRATPAPELFRAGSRLVAGAIAPRGEVFVLCDADGDGEVRVVDRKGNPLGPAMRPNGQVSRVAVTPDGARIATSIEFDLVELWDPRTGERVAAFTPERGRVHAFAFAPDGGVFALAARDFGIRLVDPESGRVLRDLTTDSESIIRLVFSEDGRRLAAASSNGVLAVWDLSAETDAPLWEGSHVGRLVRGLLFSPDSSRLAAFSSEGAVAVLDAVTGTLASTLDLDEFVSDARFSEDGAWIVTSSHDNTARVWDAATGRPVTEPLRHHSPLVISFVHRDRLEVWCLCRDNSIVTWRIRPPSMAPIVVRADGKVSDALPDRTGSRILTAVESGGRTRILDYRADGRGRPVPEPGGWSVPGPITKLASCGEGLRTAVAWGSAIQLLDAESLQPIGSNTILPSAVRSFTFSRSGDRVAAVSLDGTVRIIESATGRAIGSPLRHEGALEASGFVPDGSGLLIAGADPVLLRWQPGSDRPPTRIPCSALGPDILRFPRGGGRGLERVKFSPDRSRMLVLVGPTAILTDTQNGNTISELIHRSTIHDAEFAPGGDRVITVSNDRTGQLWLIDADGAARTRALPHSGPVLHASFSSDGTMVATGSEDGTARIWDVASGIPLTGPLVHEGPVRRVRFSGDGLRLVTASDDGTARVWTVPRVEASGRQSLALRAELAAGMRIGSDGEPQPLSYGDRESLRAQLGARAQTGSVRPLP